MFADKDRTLKRGQYYIRSIPSKDTIEIRALIGSDGVDIAGELWDIFKFKRSSEFHVKVRAPLDVFKYIFDVMLRGYGKFKFQRV